MKKVKVAPPRPTPVTGLAGVRAEQRALSTRLSELELECRSLGERCLTLEARAARFWKLYVASHRLHEPTDRQGVIAVIQEIVSAIIGSESMALVEPGQSGELEVSAAFGVEPARVLSLAKTDRSLRAALQRGESFIAQTPGRSGNPTACIPLKVGGGVAGALVVFDLLAHKPGYLEEDHVLFELLSLQAGVALRCAKGLPA